jgi:hypothetical protein
LRELVWVKARRCCAFTAPALAISAIEKVIKMNRARFTAVAVFDVRFFIGLASIL